MSQVSSIPGQTHCSVNGCLFSSVINTFFIQLYWMGVYLHILCSPWTWWSSYILFQMQHILWSKIRSRAQGFRYNLGQEDLIYLQTLRPDAGKWILIELILIETLPIIRGKSTFCGFQGLSHIWILFNKEHLQRTMEFFTVGLVNSP